MRLILFMTAMLFCSAVAAQTQITIASVNNPDMVTMRKMTHQFEKKYPDIKVNYVMLPENQVRQKVTTDIATDAGQYDVVTISNYETPIWAKNDWLVPFDNLSEDYDADDLLKPVRQGLSYDDTLYALPFYAESSITYYRKDLFEKAGLTMPDNPSWTQIRGFAKKLNDPASNTYGICLRGKAGWGLNMAIFDTMVNAYGGRWFDMDWQPQLTSKAWHKAANMYVGLLNDYGPPGVTSNGFTESETLFANGRCAQWVDSTVAAGYLSDPENSQVAEHVGFAHAPKQKTDRGSNWLYSWALAIPKSSNHQDAARKFVEWATSQDYIEAVGQEKGWVSAPPGTRHSTYKNPKYRQAASFADLVEKAIESADPQKPSIKPVPYVGVQFVDIPPFQAIGTQVGKTMAGILAGQMSVDDGLNKAQRQTRQLMQQTGYYNQ